MKIEIRFLTTNTGKFQELSKLVNRDKYKLIRDATQINELQTEKMDVLLRDKLLKAFQVIRRPLIVDHTGLSFDLLNGFPSGLTSVFYDKLGDAGIAHLIGRSAKLGATAITLIGYCDGRTVRSFQGNARGMIADEPRGRGGFQWDTIFIPKGYDKTYAELGQKKKNEISMRRIAFDAFAKFLKSKENA